MGHKKLKGSTRRLVWDKNEQRLVTPPCWRCRLGLHNKNFCACGCRTCGYNLT